MLMGNAGSLSRVQMSVLQRCSFRYWCFCPHSPGAPPSCRSRADSASAGLPMLKSTNGQQSCVDRRALLRVDGYDCCIFEIDCH